MTLPEIRNVINDMLSKGVGIESVIFKICPKCNDNHNGSCEHCAWRATASVCDVGVWIWNDGSYNKKPLQIVPRRMRTFDTTLAEWWNIQYFATKEEAETTLEEYDEIRNIEDRSERKAEFDWWCEKRIERFRDKEKEE